MIEIIGAAQFEKAAARAAAGKLFVRFVQFRQFVVVNRETGAEYNVNLFVRDGKRFGHCDCKGGDRGLACKHLACALAVHTAHAVARQAAVH